MDNFYEWSGDLGFVRDLELHLAQSEYAHRHLQDSLGIHAMMVSDYISDFFFENCEPVGFRTARIAVNPARGAREIREFRRLNRSIGIAEIAGLSRELVRDELLSTMAYVDFGNNPGKDRLAREAALLGNVVFTQKRGAAVNHVDFPIDPWYKFDSVGELTPKLREVFRNFDHHRDAQRGYVAAIHAERSVFRDEVARLVQIAQMSAPDRMGG